VNSGTVMSVACSDGAYHIKGVLDAVATENLAEVLSAVDDYLRPAEGEGVVGVRQLRLDGTQLVHLHGE
jgi:hypothetical protein